MKRVHRISLIMAALASTLAAGAAAAEPFRIAPLKLYRTADGAEHDIQFTDAKGAKLALGSYPRAVYAMPPYDAVWSDVALVEVDTGKTLTEIPPSFWNEFSLPATNNGTNVTVKPYGYALSIPVPVSLALEHRKSSEAGEPPRHLGYAPPSQIFYDEYGCQVDSWGNAHTNAAYFRVFCSYGPHNNIWLAPRKSWHSGGGRRADVVPPVPSAFTAHPGEIVIPGEADLRERFAALELARVVRLITGKSLAILREPSGKAEFTVFIGTTFAKGRYDADIDALGKSGGYALRREGDKVYAFGADSRGTLYAMVRLIEANTDFTWFRPDVRWGYAFTSREAIDFRNADERSVPAFRERTWSGPGGNSYFNEHLFMLHNYSGKMYTCRKGVFTPDNYSAKMLGHIGSIGGNYMELPMSIEEKEEYFPMINGIRNTRSRHGQPCYTNPDVIQLTRQAVREILENSPEELDAFTFDYSDSWACCECDECMKPIRLPDGRVLVAKSIVPQEDPWFRSTRTYMVANEVAEEVEKNRPDLTTRFLAYIYTAANPEVRLHPKLNIIFASYDTASMRFPLNVQTNQAYYAPESWAYRFKRWIDEAGTRMGMYEYFFTASPGMFAEAAAANMRDMAAVEAHRFHSQTQPDNDHKSYEAFGVNAHMWDVNAMDQWMISRLMWNPGQDVADLRADFLRRVYREGADDMAEYYRLFGRKWFDPAYDAWFNCHTAAGKAYTDFIIRPGIERRLYDCIDRALAKTTMPAARVHLRRKADALRLMKESTGREDVPSVAELGGEWRDAGSPHWNRALTLGSFRDPLAVNQASNEAPVRASVSLACDARNLYFRIESDAETLPLANGTNEVPQDLSGDIFQLHFLYNNGDDRQFVIGANGRVTDMQNFDWRWNSGWETQTGRVGTNLVTTGRIPMGAIRAAVDADLRLLVLRTDNRTGRMYAARGKSGGTRIPTPGHGNAYTTLNVGQESVLQPIPAASSPEPDKTMSNLAAETFRIEPGRAYAVTFTARTSRIHLPNTPGFMKDGAVRNSQFFWHWRRVYRDAGGQARGTEGGPNMQVNSLEKRSYTDIFVAPAAAAEVVYEFLPPQPEFPAVLETSDFAIAPYDMAGSLIPNWDFAAGDTRSSWDSAFLGTAMREFDGKRVYDSGYGSFSAPFALNGGKSYVLEGRRAIYGGYCAVQVIFTDSDGKTIKTASMPQEKAGSDFSFTFIAPEGSVSGTLRIYNSFVEWIKLRDTGK